jgi:hypothetical protein
MNRVATLEVDIIPVVLPQFFFVLSQIDNLRGTQRKRRLVVRKCIRQSGGFFRVFRVFRGSLESPLSSRSKGPHLDLATHFADQRGWQQLIPHGWRGDPTDADAAKQVCRHLQHPKSCGVLHSNYIISFKTSFEKYNFIIYYRFFGIS